MGSEISWTDSTFHMPRREDGRTPEISSTEPMAEFIVDARMMLGPSTENISLAGPTFDSSVLGLAESSHERTGQKLEPRFIDSWSMRGRSLIVIPGGQSSISVGSCTISRKEVLPSRSWSRLNGLLRDSHSVGYKVSGQT